MWEYQSIKKTLVCINFIIKGYMQLRNGSYVKIKKNQQRVKLFNKTV